MLFRSDRKSTRLNPDADKLILANLREIEKGNRPKTISVGSITEAQLAELNAIRAEHELPEIEGREVVFIGRHIYQRRVVEQGYSIEDVVTQICTAMADSSRANSATSIQSAQPRADGYGNQVLDRVVFECTAKKPRLELYSVVPGGDKISPREAKKKAAE